MTDIHSRKNFFQIQITERILFSISLIIQYNMLPRTSSICQECQFSVIDWKMNPLCIRMVNRKIKLFLQKAFYNVYCRIFNGIVPFFSSGKIIQEMNSGMSVFHAAIYNLLTNCHMHKIIQLHGTFFHRCIFQITVNQIISLIGLIERFKYRKYTFCIITSKHDLFKNLSLKISRFKAKAPASFPNIQKHCCFTLKMLHQIRQCIFVTLLSNKCRIR